MEVVEGELLPDDFLYLEVVSVLGNAHSWLHDESHGFLLGQPFILEKTGLLLHWAVGDAPAHALIESVSQDVMHQAEHFAPEDDVVPALASSARSG